MEKSRRTLVIVWLVTTLVTGLIAVLVYRSLARVPEFAGRADPERLLDDPTLLFTEPGILGTAVERRVTEAVAACMESAGFAYRSASPVDDLRTMRPDGYGITAGGNVHRAELGPGGSDDPAYEAALYGKSLDGAASPGGCAGAGNAVLVQTMSEMGSWPYPIEQLELDTVSHPAYVSALTEWSQCMAQRGHEADSPDQLILRLREAARQAIGAEARALADEERRIAADDFACRASTIDRALTEVAADLAPVFVEENRRQLEDLIPRQGDIELPTGLGSGDVQVTLLWSGQADLDLYVTSPEGERVYFGNRTVASGGQLDRDARYPCGSDDAQPAAENVFWPTGEAPPGRYQVEVGYTSDCAGEGDQRIELVIQVSGRVIDRVETTLTPEQGRYATSFEVAG